MDKHPIQEKEKSIKEDIQFISSNTEAKKVLSEILSESTPFKKIVGVDCEAIGEMSRFGKLSLIQICYKSKAYVFDMTQLSQIEELNQITASKEIVKILHDGNEDCSLLLNSKVVREINNIFDTQIAQRIFFESTEKTRTSKESTISLKDLLKKYFEVDKDTNNEVKSLMNSDKAVWSTRPLSESMLKYAVEDVLYLERLYAIFQKALSKDLFEQVFEESRQSIPYSYLNLSIDIDSRRDLLRTTENNNLKKGFVKISGMLKTFKEKCVYIKLNLGISGIVVKKPSISKIQSSYSRGKIMEFKVESYDESYDMYTLDLAPDNKIVLSKKAKEYFPSYTKLGSKKESYEKEKPSENLNKEEEGKKDKSNGNPFSCNTNIHAVEALASNEEFTKENRENKQQVFSKNIGSNNVSNINSGYNNKYNDYHPVQYTNSILTENANVPIYQASGSELIQSENYPIQYNEYLELYQYYMNEQMLQNQREGNPNSTTEFINNLSENIENVRLENYEGLENQTITSKAPTKLNLNNANKFYFVKDKKS